MSKLAQKLQDYGFEYKAFNDVFDLGRVRVYFIDGALTVIQFNNTTAQCIQSESTLSLALGEKTVMQLVMAIVENTK